MSLRSGTQKYGTSTDEFVNIDGYSRNLVLEERLRDEMQDAEQYNTQFKNYMNPVDTPVPSWWEASGAHHPTRWRQHYTDNEAIEYLERGKKYLQARINLMSYQCDYYPREPRECQNVVQIGGIMNSINALIEKIKADRLLYPVNGEPFEFLPQVFAEEDPSVNSGLNGNEQESQVINYPQSGNVRIIISNVSMFSTSIPINDISQLQILSNESNEWRYTLIGTSTNQPLMTLSGLINKINSMIASVVTPQPPVTQPPVTQPQPQPPVITTDHIPPPEMPVEEPPMVTATEPGQINWIPEPFFSFINSVFKK